MSEGTRAIDWLMLAIEALVLLLISYEVLAGQIRHRRDQQRRSTITERVVALSAFMDKGMRIKSCVPDPQITNWQLVKPWMDSVQKWTDETNAFLAGHSSRASSAFMLTTDAGHMDTVVYSAGRQFALFGDVRECYQRFAVQLANLRRIIEQPEAYF
jgi:hypothetical protein